MSSLLLEGFKTIRVKKMAEDAIVPTRAHPDDAGMDLYSLEDVLLLPRQGKPCRTGIAFEIPERVVGMVCDRSSCAKKGIKVAGGIIDSGYRGEVMAVLWNLSDIEVRIQKGERMAQLLLIPIAAPAIEVTDRLSETTRGAKGFGSSGK